MPPLPPDWSGAVQGNRLWTVPLWYQAGLCCHGLWEKGPQVERLGLGLASSILDFFFVKNFFLSIEN